MSTTYTTYLMLGIKTTQEESGINMWEDKWLPYIEGHPGVDIFIKYSSEESNLYIGKVLANWSRNDDSTELDIPMYNMQYQYQEDIFSIQNFINQNLKQLYNKPVSLLFFTTAN